MTRLQGLGVVAVSGVLLAGAGSADAVFAGADACGVRVSRVVPPPTVTGPPAITRRVDFIPRETAPIRIVGIDFSAASLSNHGQFKAKYSMEVENLTNELVTAVHPMVQLVKHRRAASDAAGPIARTPLAPGQRLRIDDESVVGLLEDDTHIQVSISIVGFGTCKWSDGRWSEAWRWPAEQR